MLYYHVIIHMKFLITPRIFYFYVVSVCVNTELVYVTQAMLIGIFLWPKIIVHDGVDDDDDDGETGKYHLVVGIGIENTTR